MNVSVDLGHGRRASYVWRPGMIRSKGVPTGVIVNHQPDALVKGHAVSMLWAGREPNCELESVEPLSVTGYVECGCGDVGTIRDGHWVPQHEEAHQ